jgi:hypothetical protein
MSPAGPANQSIRSKFQKNNIAASLGARALLRQRAVNPDFGRNRAANRAMLTAVMAHPSYESNAAFRSRSDNRAE